MVADQRAVSIAVDARRIGNVVSVGLEPAHHRVFGVEDPVLSTVNGARIEGSVIADFVRASRRLTGIEAVTTVVVVRLPRRVRCLEQHIRMTTIVADDEEDMARAIGVDTHDFGEIDAGDGRLRHGPRSRYGPVAAIDEPRRTVGQARWLVLGQRRRRRHGRHFPCAAATVIAHPINVESIVRRRRLYFEENGRSFIDTDIGPEALDRRIPCPTDVPFARRISGEAVLCDGRVRRRRANARGTCGCERRCDVHRQSITRHILDPRIARAADQRRGVCRPGHKRRARHKRRGQRGCVVT